ncbi:MAG: hypothetical protein FI687_04660 [SAR202 cluster bacterium]|nr:hypothetical protein [SAR202 cluster bacterium]|tara:strand:- start:16660 stop:17202 length:543 start_codon:yes stop_codon:yes gene_type:complete
MEFQNKFSNSTILFLILLISLLAISFSISCSEKSGAKRGILIQTSQESIPVPLVAWIEFNYNDTNTCQVSAATGMNTKKTTRVEILEKATCSQTIIIAETGETSTFSTGLSKIRFPSLNNTGNANNGTFNEVWALTSTIQITEEKFSSVGREEQSSSDRNRKRKELKEEIEAKNAQRQER